jgi:NAD(P)-dependent dehydrogenase (short-subunit alcohol dehydrogenase family)
MNYVILTGATSGIGLALAGRLLDTGTLLIQGPEDSPPAYLLSRRNVHYVQSDFGALSDVHDLAAQALEIGRPDILINNAAIPGPPQFEKSRDGVELTFQVNYLAGALLTDLLLPGMPASGRIVNTASATHYSASLDLDDLDFRRERYSPVAAYSRSKLAIVAASQSLASRIPQRVLSVHPGVISTTLLHAMFGAGGDSVDHGAATLEAAMFSDAPSGAYLDELTPAGPNPIAVDTQFQERLRDVTSDLLGREIR